MRVLCALIIVVAGIFIDDIAFQACGYIGVFLATAPVGALATIVLRWPQPPKRFYRAELFRHTLE